MVSCRRGDVCWNLSETHRELDREADGNKRAGCSHHHRLEIKLPDRDQRGEILQLSPVAKAHGVRTKGTTQP